MTEQEALLWLAGLLDESPGRMTVETSRADIPAWDSLGVLTLMASLDERFSLIVSDDDMRQMRRVGDLLDLLRRHGKLTG